MEVTVNNMESKICKYCDKEFSGRAGKRFSTRKYCSTECSILYHNKIHLPPLLSIRFSGESSSSWKGSGVGYSGLHMWVRKWLGTPNRCEDCGTMEAKKFEWANISKQYLREITDWKRLCHKCHIKFDDSLRKGWRNKKLRQEIKL